MVHTIFCDKHDLIECVWQHVYDIVTHKNILLFFTAKISKKTVQRSNNEFK